MKEKNYISNQKMYNELVKYYDKLAEAEKEEREEPRIPDYLGECFLLIAENLAKKPNFSSYTFKEDMIQDGVLTCVANITKFDPDRTNNPFSYFTQAIFYSFLQRIAKEKKQEYVKYKSIEKKYFSEEMGATNELDKGSFKTSDNNNLEVFDNYLEFIEDYEDKFLPKKSRERKRKKDGFQKKPVEYLFQLAQK
jgi:hypothetical protein